MKHSNIDGGDTVSNSVSKLSVIAMTAAAATGAATSAPFFFDMRSADGIQPYDLGIAGLLTTTMFAGTLAVHRWGLFGIPAARLGHDNLF